MAWLPGYSKRQPLPVTGGASGAQADFQLKLAVPYAAAMQSDFDDLRFTQANGTTLIDAWLESKVNDGSAAVWAEFPTTPANTVEQTYYMYYGNAGAASDWDGGETFIAFNDFEGGVGNWVEDAAYPGGSVSSDSGVVKIGSKSTKHQYDSSTSAFFHPLTTISSDVAVEFYKRTRNTNQASHFSLIQGQTHNTTKQSSYLSMYSDGNIRYYDGSWHNIMAYSANTWYRFKLCNFNFGADTYDIYIDDMNNAKVTGAGFRNSLASFDNFEIMENAASNYSYIDMLFIRKHVANPPTYVFGAEESAPTGAAPTSIFSGPFVGPLGGPI